MSRPTAFDRRAEKEREARERRDAAEERADTLIRAASDAAPTPRAALVEVARRAAAALELEQCDLLILRSAERAVLVEIRVAPFAKGGQRAGDRDESARAEQNIRIRDVRIPPTASPTTLLHGDGPANRVHIFIHHASSLRPLGVLSIAAPPGRLLSIDDRAFANAIGDRLAAAIAQGDFPGLS